MRRHLAAVAAASLLLISGCASTIQKNFKVIADPPDSVVKVVDGTDLKAHQYRSPAQITAEVPKDPALAVKAVLEVSNAAYKTRTLGLADIKDGDTLNIKLEKLILHQVRYRLKFRMISPVKSEEIKYRDNYIAISFTVGEQSFDMNLENLSPFDLKILWDQAQYMDPDKHENRVMHPGIRNQDRNNPIPAQLVPSGTSVKEAVIPVNSVVFSQQKRLYSILPLFKLDSDAAAGLKGKGLYLFIPIEIDRQIIPYQFRIEIADAIRETT